jgi:hypothetical protein
MNAGSSGSYRYQVSLPITPVRHDSFKTPAKYTSRISVEQTAGGYRADVVVEAKDEPEASDTAKKRLDEFLACEALRGVAFFRVDDDSEVTVRNLTPTGVGAVHMRGGGRAGIVVSPNDDLVREATERYAGLQEPIPQALSLFHLGKIAHDPAVAFLLFYTSLEVLADSQPKETALCKAVPDEQQRKELLDRVKAVLRDAISDETLRKRILEHLENAQAVSPVLLQLLYLRSIDVPANKRTGKTPIRKDLQQYRKYRGRIAHGKPPKQGDEFRECRRKLEELLHEALTRVVSLRLEQTRDGSPLQATDSSPS